MSENPSKPTNLLKTYGIAVGTAIVVALLIRFSLIESFRIPTSVMRPSLQPGDVIFVTKWNYGFKIPFFTNKIFQAKRNGPRLGDIIVYSLKTDSGSSYIKRIVAAEGQGISAKNGYLYVNHKKLEVDFSINEVCGIESHQGRGIPVCLEPPLVKDFVDRTIPKGSVFVIGDLRSQKKNRPWAIIPISAIQGKARWVWLSLSPEGERLSSRFLPEIRFNRMFREIK